MSTPLSQNKHIYDTLYNNFPELRIALDKVGILDIHSLMKQPYPALIGVIAGQKITFVQAKQIRSYFYKTLGGTNFTREQVESQSLKLNKLECWPIVERLNLYLSLQPADFLELTNSKLEINIRSLADNIKGIGPWTIESTLLTCLADKMITRPDTNNDPRSVNDNLNDLRSVIDIFPIGDKFLQNALVRLKLLEKPIKISNVKKVSSTWTGYRGWITWYLWRWFP
jgi:3-methyladenine DNA glycosylase/8-oxoguanine DNA glycosylase